jgi:hypothetical protein
MKENGSPVFQTPKPQARYGWCPCMSSARQNHRVKICQPVGHFNVIAPVIAEEKLCWIRWNGAELQGPFDSAMVFSQTDPLQIVLHRLT